MMRVLIVAENGLTAEGIRRELRHTPTFDVVGFVDGRGSCHQTISLAAPDVVVIDEMDAGSRVLARIRETREAAPAAKLVLITMSMDPSWLADAASAGIDAAVTKVLNPSGLGALIRHVVAGQVFHAFAEAPQMAQGNDNDAGLTERELEILRLVAAGLSNGRIAKKLWVSEQTVKFHLSNTYRKLGVSNRTEASRYAHVRGLVEIYPEPVVGAAA
jgi:DNA-binding NarL/FixJ family response regulator